MQTILNLSEVFKNFGNHLFENGALKSGYADFLVLLALGSFCSIIYTLFERSNAQ